MFINIAFYGKCVSSSMTESTSKRQIIAADHLSPRMLSLLVFDENNKHFLVHTFVNIIFLN